ncbi:hypothetical protein JY651_37035 [Pyxidicoccus parkwayensis]|uniref:Uncharacterized protein n=1 Tax=Pyxidicoccus parkwayensis TaxID=2813578 RepID=A0ABX7NQ32_9BACT|nr:hypothetical protein [Pyxidicoccus parkwaysis]QSQ20793.1 hypothetical protein JY651_37035 [Pyxidicoccus parkwaysis]
MALSTLLLVLGIAVLHGAPVEWLVRHRVWARAGGGVSLAAGVVLAVKARGLAVGLTCALVLAMLATGMIALCAPLWPRATRWVLPVSAVGLALMWLGMPWWRTCMVPRGLPPP